MPSKSSSSTADRSGRGGRGAVRRRIIEAMRTAIVGSVSADRPAERVHATRALVPDARILHPSGYAVAHGSRRAGAVPVVDGCASGPQLGVRPEGAGDGRAGRGPVAAADRGARPGADADMSAPTCRHPGQLPGPPRNDIVRRRVRTHTCTRPHPACPDRSRTCQRAAVAQALGRHSSGQATA